MPAAIVASTLQVRHNLTRSSLRLLMRELAQSVPRAKAYDVYLVGGGTAVVCGWRESSIDADLYAPQDDIFRDIQNIKERLQLNVEFVRPEDFVPPLAGSSQRHVFVENIGKVSFHHYDPYAQVFSKITRGFARDLTDARAFVDSGMVQPERLRELVQEIPKSSWSRYPRLSPAAVLEAIDDFLANLR